VSESEVSQISPRKTRLLAQAIEFTSVRLTGSGSGFDHRMLIYSGHSVTDGDRPPAGGREHRTETGAGEFR
jgi:hypothetical protein